MLKKLQVLAMALVLATEQLEEFLEQGKQKGQLEEQ